jgi:hypothetical protein
VRPRPIVIAPPLNWISNPSGVSSGVTQRLHELRRGEQSEKFDPARIPGASARPGFAAARPLFNVTLDWKASAASRSLLDHASKFARSRDEFQSELRPLDVGRGPLVLRQILFFSIVFGPDDQLLEDASPAPFLFVAQGLDRVEPRCFARWIESEKDPDRCADEERRDNRRNRDKGRPIREDGQHP